MNMYSNLNLKLSKLVKSTYVKDTAYFKHFCHLMTKQNMSQKMSDYDCRRTLDSGK